MKNGSVPEAASSLTARTPRRKRRLVLRIVLIAVLVAVVWALTSQRPFAQGVQEMLGSKHDQTIIDKPFSVGPHTFRYYKFSISPGSANVAIVGRFVASDAGGNSNAGDDGIEVSLLEESAFSLWQSVGAATSLYESGRIRQGAIDQKIPAGAGTYYLVFSNRFAAQTPKTIHASILARYSGWMPVALRRAGSRFWGWFGL